MNAYNCSCAGMLSIGERWYCTYMISMSYFRAISIIFPKSGALARIGGEDVSVAGWPTSSKNLSSPARVLTTSILPEPFPTFL